MNVNRQAFRHFVLNNPQECIPCTIVDGHEMLTEGWQWYQISMNTGEVGHVAFSSPTLYHLYVCVTQNIKLISARINRMLRLADYDEAFRTQFIPAVDGLIIRFGTFLVPYDIQNAYDSVLESLDLPSIAKRFWPERMEVPNHVSETYTVLMSAWRDINREVELEVKLEQAAAHPEPDN